MARPSGDEREADRRLDPGRGRAGDDHEALRGSGALMRRLAVAVPALLALLWPAPAAAHHEPLGGRPVVAFLVNGYGGCCVPGSLRDWLVDQRDENTGQPLVAVHVSNWNHVDQGGNPGAFPFGGFPDPSTDETFIQQLEQEIAEIDAVAPRTKIILIGHSFGGDAVLQVAKRLEASPGVPRPIAFLAVLDPVGRAGLRTNVTYPVPPNVEYFYNRWQTNAPYPLDFPRSGRLESRADESNQDAQSLRKTGGCKVKYTLGFIPELMLHAQVPNDSCVQAQLRKIIEARVLNPNPRATGASVVLSGGVVGVRVRFSEPINILSFTLADVVSASPRRATAVEAVPGSGGHQFLIRFEPPPFVPPPASRPLQLVLGPDIYDADGRAMDQDLDLRPGEVLDDRYSFTYGIGGPDLVAPRIVGLKFVFEAEGRLKRIVGIVLTLDRSVLTGVATDLANYRLLAPGRDGRFGTADDRPLSIRTATYDRAKRTVTLLPRAPLAAAAAFQLVVEGTALAPYRAAFGARPRSEPSLRD
jgi:hypothetical protein